MGGRAEVVWSLRKVDKVQIPTHRNVSCGQFYSTQTGLPVQRIPPLAPGDLIPWSRPQDVAPLPAYSTRPTVFIRTHMQGEPKPFSALWGFGVPGGVEDSGHDSCNNNKWRMLCGIRRWKPWGRWQGASWYPEFLRSTTQGSWAVNNSVEEEGIEYVTPHGRCGGSEGDQARNAYLLGIFFHTRRETKENRLLPTRLPGGEVWKTAQMC